MKIIVFGGAGFLGSHVADELTKQGHEVIIYDIRHSHYVSGRQQMIVGDILNDQELQRTMEGCDCVYNFAGEADIARASENPLATVKNNILGNTVLIECARRAAVKRFIFASSLYVYGRFGSFYRSSKQACELIIENYHEIYGMDYTILRYGSLYGPRSNEDNWIYSVIKSALVNGKVIRMGDGEELREYIHVQDAAKLSVMAMADEYRNQHVIITGEQQMKIKDLLMMIREMLGGKLVVEYKPGDMNDHYEITPYVFKPTMAKRLCEKHYYDLGQGILEMMGEIYKQCVTKKYDSDFHTLSKVSANGGV